MTLSRRLPLRRRLLRAVVGITAAAAVMPVADASATVVTSPRFFTCLVRTSDGFNGCWLDGTTPGDSINNAREWQKGDGCNGIHTIYLSDTPAYRGSIPRAGSIGSVLGDNYGNQLAGTGVPWYGLGQGTNQYFGGENDRGPGSIITDMIALDAVNRFARVEMYFTGASWCKWKRT